MKRGEAGFTLAEVVVASALGCFVLGAAVFLLTSVLRAHASSLGQVSLESRASLVVLALARACEAADAVTVDPAGSSRPAVRAMLNYDPSDGSRLVAGEPQTFRHYCFDAQAGFHVYEGGLPAPAIRCGADAQGTRRFVLAPALGGETAELEILRSGATELSLSVRLSLPERPGAPSLVVRRRTGAVLQGAFIP